MVHLSFHRLRLVSGNPPLREPESRSCATVDQLSSPRARYGQAREPNGNGSLRHGLAADVTLQAARGRSFVVTYTSECFGIVVQAISNSGLCDEGLHRTIAWSHSVRWGSQPERSVEGGTRACPFCSSPVSHSPAASSSVNAFSQASSNSLS